MTGDDDGVTKYYSVVNEECYEDLIPDFDDYYFCGCSLGWLILSDNDNTDCYLLNPLTLEKIQLPPFDFEEGFECRYCLLSSLPNDPECHVLFIGEGSIYFCKLGDDHLKKQEFQLDQKVKNMKFTTLQGKVFCMITLTSELWVIICKDSALEFTKLIVQNPHDILGPSCAFYNTYLIESGGELLLVTKTYHPLNLEEVSGFWIVRFDFATNMWKKVDDIGKRTIFLGGGIGFSVLGGEENGVKENSIYFIESHCLNVFDLEDDSLTMILSMSSVETPLHWLYFMSPA